MKKGVTAYLQGGLGNQCFIYSTARSLSLDSGAQLSFIIDRFKDDRVFRRKLELDKFNCLLDLQRVGSRPERMLSNLWHGLFRRYACRNPNYCPELKTWVFQDLPRTWRGILKLDGVWQCERYFYHNREFILDDFSLKDPSWLESDSAYQKIKASEDAIFLHVRSYTDIPGREDYSGALKVSYYENALRMVAERVPSGRTVFIFSDDLNWAVGRLSNSIKKFGFNMEVPSTSSNATSEVPPHVRDFMLMRCCRHSILANSSFSWWAAWLGEMAHNRRGESTIRIRPRTRCMGETYWPDRWLVAEL